MNTFDERSSEEFDSWGLTGFTAVGKMVNRGTRSRRRSDSSFYEVDHTFVERLRIRREVDTSTSSAGTTRDTTEMSLYESWSFLGAPFVADHNRLPLSKRAGRAAIRVVTEVETFFGDLGQEVSRRARHAGQMLGALGADEWTARPSGHDTVPDVVTELNPMRRGLEALKDVGASAIEPFMQRDPSRDDL